MRLFISVTANIPPSALDQSVIMAEVPGSVGFPLLGDKSYEFYKNPIKFLEKNMQQCRSRLFATRFLNKPTVFVCSNKGVRDVLADKEGCFELGYKAFMGQIFGDNILFTDGDEAHMFRDALGHLFTSDAIHSYESTVKRIAAQHVARLRDGQSLCLYEFFKHVVTEICLSLFLGLDFLESQEAADTIVALTTQHWHGIISVPLQIRLPGVNNASTYSKAMDAKQQLLDYIQSQRNKTSRGFVRRIEEVVSSDDDVFVNNHLLLFTSALVPKAMASLLTSIAIEVAADDMASMEEELRTNSQLKECLFKEVQRLYPPFLGGRRVVRKDCVVDGYRIPAGYAVVYMTHPAHRDPTAFTDPEQFKYQRWMTEGSSSSDENLFGFGYGPRGCIGQKLVWNIIDIVLSELLTCYRWVLLPDQDLAHKYLPVSRPKGSILVTLNRQSAGSTITTDNCQPCLCKEQASCSLGKKDTAV